MYGIATALLSILAFTAPAATITIPSTTVLGTDVFSGPTFTLTSAVQPTDVLTLTASGQVFLQTAGTAYGTNPAGVVTTAGTTSVGGTSLNGTTNFGSLLLGNSTLGFVQLFPATAANGLGSSTPPSSLTLSSVTLNSVGFISALPSGTVLQFRISDINTFDNGGQFTVSGQIVTADVPEPSAGLLAIAGIGFLFLIRRRCLP
jgi:hypothetical protein